MNGQTATDPSSETPEIDLEAQYCLEARQRAWLKVLTGVLNTLPTAHDMPVDEKLAVAYCRMYSAVAERVARICRHDMMG